MIKGSMSLYEHNQPNLDNLRIQTNSNLKNLTFEQKNASETEKFNFSNGLKSQNNTHQGHKKT